MKIKIIAFVFLICICASLATACDCNSKQAIELMGAGDRIHDSYTFANHGTNIKANGKNTYLISGSVDKLIDENVKKEFKIDENIDYIVAIKLSAIEEDVVKEEVVISVNGVENYDAEHLNGASHTFIILEARPGATVNVSVKWNKDAKDLNYIINFDENLELK